VVEPAEIEVRACDPSVSGVYELWTSTPRRILPLLQSAALLSTLLLGPRVLLAQTPPAAPPPPAPQPPQAGPQQPVPPDQAPQAAPAFPPQAAPTFGYPPYPTASWQQPGIYGAQPAAPPLGQLPPRYPYQEGQLIPPGYHLEERPRRGFVTAGYIVTGVPYAIGLLAAFSADFANHSGWLVVPFVGPWLTLGRRDNACIGTPNDVQDDGECWKDAVMAPLILDGIVQTVGGTFLLIGYLATKEWVVRDDLAYLVVPSPIGSGYGLNFAGTL
jgi:hypothetical protein